MKRSDWLSIARTPSYDRIFLERHIIMPYSPLPWILESPMEDGDYDEYIIFIRHCRAKLEGQISKSKSHEESYRRSGYVPPEAEDGEECKHPDIDTEHLIKIAEVMLRQLDFLDKKYRSEAGVEMIAHCPPEC